MCSMTLSEVKRFFQEKDQTPCPVTEKLVKAGYQQTGGGYIARARNTEVSVDYTQNLPSQYWHLMSYCDSRKQDIIFSKSIVCGELIFWMAEVSGCVSNDILEQLANRIIASRVQRTGKRPVYDRKKWNHEIQEVCFDKIEETIKQLM